MSAEHVAVLLAARLATAQAAEGALLAEAKAGHLNFRLQPGAACGHLNSSTVSPATGGADVHSMSIACRDSGPRSLSACSAGRCSAEAEQPDIVAGMHLAGSLAGNEPAPSHTAASSRHAHIGAKLSSLAPCHAGTAVPEQLQSSPPSKASSEPSRNSKMDIHIDAGYANAKEGFASMEFRHQPTEAAGSSLTDNRGSDAGPGPSSQAEQTR